MNHLSISNGQEPIHTASLAKGTPITRSNVTESCSQNRGPVGCPVDWLAVAHFAQRLVGSLDGLLDLLAGVRG